MQIEAPMLCARAESEADLAYPCLATPKLDGIRALMVEGQALTRRWKPVGNLYIRRWMQENLPDGLDGELIVPDADFSEASGLIRRADGKPDFAFAAFDYCLLAPYSERMQRLRSLSLPSRVQLVLPTLCTDSSDLLRFEEKCLEEGYEGVIARQVNGPYKFGRSSLREQYAVKLKRFADSEARIVGFVEGKHNLNPQVPNAFGRMKRPGGSSGHVPADTLGKLLCVDIHTGVEISIGGGKGLTHALRHEIWNNKAAYVGRIICYEHQLCGAKDKPRFPRFAGFRDEGD